MNAIAKNTERKIDDLSLGELSEVANTSADCIESDMKSAVRNAIIAGQALNAAKAKVGHGRWGDWITDKTNWRFSQNLAIQYMQIANSQRAGNLDSATSIREALRIIADAKEDKPEPKQLNLLDNEVDSVVVSGEFVCTTCEESFSYPVWHCESCGHHWGNDVDECKQCSNVIPEIEVEYQDVEQIETEDDADEPYVKQYDDDEPQVKQKQFYTIAEWEATDDIDRIHLFAGGDKTLNKQDNNSIEWAQWSWNPITGCKHDCPYCYARDIANRFYEQKFEPSIYPSRYSAPKNTAVPEKAEADTAFKNIFTGSMADIFGRWVPKEWINRVIGVAQECPQWNFLFLTKFPQRVHEFGKLPTNVWMGTTVDCQDRVDNAEKAFAKMGGGIKWLSIEPMLTPLKFKKLELFDWVVIGGASKSSQTPAWVPPLDWIVDLHAQARAAGCAIYYKDNMQMGSELRIKEFPWQDRSVKQLPESMKYLNIK